MIMTNFLKNRKSVREFKKKSIGAENLEKVRARLEDLSTEDVSFKLYENGGQVYDSLKGIGGYSGVMIESPHYIGLLPKTKEDKNIIEAAYLMEELISEINKLNLDTCWVSLNTVPVQEKKEILGDHMENADFLLAVGYSKPRNPFVSETTSDRKGVEEIVFSEDMDTPASIEDLEARGLSDLFYYVRFAPSAKNAQPWRFLLKDNKAYLLMDKSNLNLTDAGIIMYYFKGLAETIGISNQWEILLDKEEGDYKYIAEIKL